MSQRRQVAGIFQSSEHRFGSAGILPAFFRSSSPIDPSASYLESHTGP
jgi:hypothetical protein